MTRSHTASSPRANARRTNTLVGTRKSQSQHRVLRKTTSALLLTVTGCLIALSTSGCSTTHCGGAGGWLFSNLIEQPVANYRERIWAKRAFNLRYPNCENDFPTDFRAGFIEGYCNACAGGDSHPPALPPESYWTSRYKTEEGSNKVDSWFAGFPAGAKAAQADGNGQYHQIKVSSELQQAITQIRNQGEDVVGITSIEPTNGNQPIPETQMSSGPAYNQFASPDYTTPNNYLGQDDSLPPIVTPDRTFPVSSPGQGTPMGNPGSYGSPPSYGAPIGNPGRWNQR